MTACNIKIRLSFSGETLLISILFGVGRFVVIFLKLSKVFEQVCVYLQRMLSYKYTAILLIFSSSVRPSHQSLSFSFTLHKSIFAIINAFSIRAFKVLLIQELKALIKFLRSPVSFEYFFHILLILL